MFFKPYKLKSNAPLKNSDSKRFRLRIQQSYPHIAKKQLQHLIPSKSVITVLKLTTYSDIYTSVYCVDKRPIFFEIEDELLAPTVHTMWIIPNLLPYFKTHAGIIPRLSHGADLNLKAIVSEDVGENVYGHYKKRQLIAINLTTDESSVGIGVLLKSSEDLRACERDESAVKVLHIFGDELWKQEPYQASVKSIKTAAGTEKVTKTKVSQETVIHKKEQEAMADEEINGNQVKDLHSLNCLTKEVKHFKINTESLDEVSIANTVLRNAFLCALKRHEKDIVLPLLTSNFYRLYVVPEAKTQIDLKKTIYKKLSNFLNEMADEGFIVVHEETKGVDKITLINYDHKELVNLADSKSSRDKKNSQQPLYNSEMIELYLITDEVMSFFGQLNLFKLGEGISCFQLKSLLREYVSKKNLPLANHVNQSIKLDTCLREICKRSDAPIWKIFNIMISKMKHSYEMRNTKVDYENKPFIRLSLASRYGERKITRISNLQCYGIVLVEFIKLCKKGAATSTTIVKVPNQNREMLQMQGDQVGFVFNLLTETYKIPAENIQELDLTKKD